MMTSTLDVAQAVELSQLVEMEARWENLRGHPAPMRGSPAREDLTGIQRAYEWFHTQLVSYNRRHNPRHVPELLLNTADRLGRWCANMGDLLRKVEAEPKARCPVHLIEKAYRRAEGIARRLQHDPLPRRSPPDTIRAAIEDLEILGRWCSDLRQVSATSAPAAPAQGKA